MTELDTYLSELTPGKGIAFFDLDRTLIAGYSIVAMAWETARMGAQQSDLSQAAKLAMDVLRQRQEKSGASYHKLVRNLAGALTGFSEATLGDLGERAYRNHIARSIYRESISLVEAHRKAGHKLVIVSAASRYQIEPIAHALGIEEICCTQLEVVNGHFSGRVIAPLCYGEGKLMAARRVAKRSGHSLGDAWFYTDSSADVPLLKKVGHPVAVNPSTRLTEEAGKHHWPLLNFSTRRGPKLEQLMRTSLVGQSMLFTTMVGAASRRLGFDGAGHANRLTQMVGDICSGFAGLDFEIEGADNLLRHQPAVFVFNHQSLLDSLVLAHLLRGDVVAMCKKEMADNPLVGPLLKQLDTIFVDRDGSDQSLVLKQAMAVLASGRSLVIAPEGTRSTLGEIQPFKHGAFVLAKRASVPIVPIVLHNVKDALPKGALLLRPATIRVTVLPAIEAGEIRSVRRSCADLESRYMNLLCRSTIAALPQRAWA